MSSEKKTMFQNMLKFNYLGLGGSEETEPNQNFTCYSHGSKASYHVWFVTLFMPTCFSVTLRHEGPLMIRSRVVAGCVEMVDQ